MKITGVETFSVKTPPPHQGGSAWVFLKLRTDAGVDGFGEVYTYGIPFDPRVIEGMIHDLVEQLVTGHDPYRTEALFQKLYGHGYGHSPELTRCGLISAIEMACWDIVGKDVGRPVHELLGGRVRERLRTYTYLYPDAAQRKSNVRLWREPEACAERALHYCGLGFTGVKLDPVAGDDIVGAQWEQHVPWHYSPRELGQAEAVIRAIRNAVGDRCDILIGTHGQMTAAGAVRLAKRLEPYDPLWFEEPVPPENMEEMAFVARHTSIPICTGERLATKYDFARLIRSQAAAIFNLDMGRVGGLLEAKKIAGMAEANYLQISPHVWGGPLIAAASIQIAACCPNFLILESIADFGGFHAEILKEPIEWKDGFIIPSKRPGLGYELNEAVARKHPVG